MKKRWLMLCFVCFITLFSARVQAFQSDFEYDTIEYRTYSRRLWYEMLDYINTEITWDEYLKLPPLENVPEMYQNTPEHFESSIREDPSMKNLLFHYSSTFLPPSKYVYMHGWEFSNIEFDLALRERIVFGMIAVSDIPAEQIINHLKALIDRYELNATDSDFVKVTEELGHGIFLSTLGMPMESASIENGELKMVFDKAGVYDELFYNFETSSIQTLLEDGDLTQITLYTLINHVPDVDKWQMLIDLGKEKFPSQPLVN